MVKITKESLLTFWAQIWLRVYLGLTSACTQPSHESCVKRLEQAIKQVAPTSNSQPYTTMKSTKLILVLALGLTTSGVSSAQATASDANHRNRPGAMVRAHLLKKFDTNGDHQLSEAERAAALAQFKTNHPDLFAKADANGDGKLSMEERIAMRRAIWKHVLAKFDTDGDGKLSDPERKAAREAFQQRAKERHAE